MSLAIGKTIGLVINKVINLATSRAVLIKKKLLLASLDCFDDK